MGYVKHTIQWRGWRKVKIFAACFVMWSSQQTSYTEDLPCGSVSVKLSHKENWDNIEKAEVQYISEAFTPRPSSTKVTFHKERLNISPRQPSLPEEVQLFNQSISTKRLVWVWNIQMLWKRSGKMDLNRELAAQRVALPDNKNRDRKKARQAQAFTANPLLHREENGVASFRRVSQGIASYQGILPTPFLRAFSHILRASKVSIFISDTILNLTKIIGWVVRHQQPGWSGEWNTEEETLRGSNSSSTMATCFLCSLEPKISTRLFSYPQNEDITTYLTGQKIINEEGISIAHGHLACQGQLWVAMTHTPTKFAKPPPEDWLSGVPSFHKTLRKCHFPSQTSML